MPPTLCTVLLAMGLTFGGLCVEKEGVEPELPTEDIGVWDANPPPAPPTPEPVFPPVVIREQVIREVAPPTSPLPLPPPIEPKPAPDPYRVWLESRRGNFIRPASLSWREIPLARPAEPEPTLPPDTPPLNAPAAASFTPPTEKQDPAYDYESTVSTEPVSNERVITTDRYITGIIETGINTQLSSKEGGNVIIQVSRPVYGYGTRNILIPTGSRLVCSYESPDNINATRIGLTCKRILLAGDRRGRRVEITELEAPVGNQQGHAGLSGKVHNHFFKKYGTAFLLTAISASVRASAGLVDDDKEKSTSKALSSGSEEISTRFGEITASILEKTVNIAPVITISQGKRVQIRPRKDWYLTEVTS